jgi:hypothetical protein
MLRSNAAFALFSIVIVGLIILNSWYINRRRRGAWGAFADQYGLRLAPRELRITGTHEGRQVELEMQQRRSGNSTYGVTVLRMALSDAFPPGFSLEREGLGDKFLKLFGKKDEEIGDEAFDKYFDLKNLSPTTAMLLRHLEVRQHLFDAAKAYQQFSISDGWLLAEKRGVPSKPEALEALIAPAFTLARTLESAHGGHRA